MIHHIASLRRVKRLLNHYRKSEAPWCALIQRTESALESIGLRYYDVISNLEAGVDFWKK
jgi:hypothetical protein